MKAVNKLMRGFMPALLALGSFFNAQAMSKPPDYLPQDRLAQATLWYVDNQATGSNTGTSWKNAWNSLSAINWNQVNPGDTVYISGGQSGKTYPGGITISENGAASGYITIDAGANSPSPAGHGGIVTIDGGNYCIRASGSYFKIKNLLCQHATDGGLRIEGSGVILENNTVREIYGQGIHLYHCTGCIVRGNRVTTFPNDGPGESRPYQTDGIVVYDSSDTLVEYNWVKLTNQYQPAHIDGIQASTTIGTSYRNITIQYNYVENTKDYTSNSQGIYLTQMQGDVRIVGNVVNHLYGNQSVVSRLLNNNPVNVFVVGNTVKCGPSYCIRVEDDNPVVKNNLLWKVSNTYGLVRLDGWLSGNAGNIDHNLYYGPAATALTYFMNSSGLDWKSWQSKGFDKNGIFGQNPNLDGCLRPHGTDSPSIGHGAILETSYDNGLSTALCGQNGPDGFLPVLTYSRSLYGDSNWDIGAYEYAQNAIPSPTFTLSPTITTSPTFTSTATVTASPSPTPNPPTATPTAVPATATVTASPSPTPNPPTATPTAVTTTPHVPSTPTSALPGQYSMDIRVITGNNDVEEKSTGRISTQSANLQLVYDNGAQIVGIRFEGVNIPGDAVIVNAYIQFQADKATSRTTTLVIQSEANANAPAFSNARRNVSSRPRSVNSVTWSPPPWQAGAMDSAQQTPNLAPIIQEVISQPDWIPGNSLVIILTGNGKRVAKAYEGNHATAPLLHIEYIISGTSMDDSDSADPNAPSLEPTPTPTLPPLESMDASLSPSLDLPQDLVAETPVANDNAPALVSPAAVEVVENTTTVITVAALDADQPAQAVGYSIAGGADAAHFNLDPLTGVLTFITAPDFESPADADADNIYRLTIQVSDGTLSATQDMVVTVAAANDNAPALVSPAAVDVVENTTTVITVAALDADQPAQAVGYSITGGADAAHFNLDPLTGVLTFITAPDFESPADADADNIYRLTIQVSDGTLSATQDMVVTVAAVMTAPP